MIWGYPIVGNHHMWPMPCSFGTWWTTRGICHAMPRNTMGVQQVGRQLWPSHLANGVPQIVQSSWMTIGEDGGFYSSGNLEIFLHVKKMHTDEFSKQSGGIYIYIQCIYTLQNDLWHFFGCRTPHAASLIAPRPRRGQKLVVFIGNQFRNRNESVSSWTLDSLDPFCLLHICSSLHIPFICWLTCQCLLMLLVKKN